MFKLAMVLSILLLSISSLNSLELNGHTFIWTAVGDDGMEGTATEYDFRRFVDTVDWVNGAQILTFTPKPAFSIESLYVSFDNNVYLWAIKTIDEVGNKSTISNVITTGISPVTGEWK